MTNATLSASQTDPTPSKSDLGTQTNLLPILGPPNYVPLEIRPISLREANVFVKLYHSHCTYARHCRFCLAVYTSDLLVGVIICALPQAPQLSDGFTLEVTRCCTIGTPNAVSKLYGAVARAARAMGYRRIITYTLWSESAKSLKACGFLRTKKVYPRIRSNDETEGLRDYSKPITARWLFEL